MKEIVVKTIADILPASKGTVKIPREDKLLIFPVKGLTLKDQNEIEENYEEPQAPKQWQKIPGSDKPVLIDNPTDANHVKAVRAVKQNKTRETILRGLDIEIPGKTIEEKWQALLDTGLAVGDIEILSTEIAKLSNLNEGEIEKVKGFFEQEG